VGGALNRTSVSSRAKKIGGARWGKEKITLRQMFISDRNLRKGGSFVGHGN